MSDSSETSDIETEDPKIQGKREIFKVNNVPALNAKLNATQLNLDWVEKLDVAVNVEENENIVDETDSSPDSKAENDFKREMSFYNQALHAVGKAFKKLHKLGIPTKRPSDFFAEMAKSDSHMNKVREKLLSKQTAVERRDQVRAIREQKKQGKKIQQQVLSERKSEKKKMLNALKKTKKGKMDVDTLLNTKKDIPKFNKGKKLREIRDMKYGYGGKKKNSKRNTAESTDSFGQKKGGMSFGQKRGGMSFGQKRGGMSFGQKGDGQSFGQKGGGMSFGQKGDGMSFGQKGGGMSFGQKGGGMTNRFSKDKKFGRPRPKKQRRRR